MQDLLKEMEDEKAAEGAGKDEMEMKDLEAGKAADAPAEGGEEFMPEFFKEVGHIKSNMALIRRNIKAIEDSYGQQLLSANNDASTKSSEELERLVNSTNEAANEIRNKLKSMDAENKKLKQGSAEFRIRISMHGTLTRKFLDLMAEYQEVQTKYKNKFREKVERQYRIAKPEATQQEIDDAFESGKTEVFTEIILDQRHAAAKEALAYIENRHRDVLKLEQSIRELHQLFMDMAILVDAQAELIDQIEFNVSQSVAYAKKAVTELQGANKYQKKSRRNMCILLACLVILIIILTGGLGIGLGI
jgi:syntaxin 1A/syntaxin 1B/2/3